VRYPGITHETSTVRRAHEDMRRFRCKIGERHIAVRRFEQYVDSRWRRRLNQNSSQGVRFVWLEPVSLAENHIEIARRSGCRCAGRKFEVNTAAGSPTVTAAFQERRDPGQRSQGWHCIPAIGWRTERKSVSCSAIPAPQSRRSQGGKALRASRVGRLSNLHDRLCGFEGRRGNGLLSCRRLARSSDGFQRLSSFSLCCCRSLETPSIIIPQAIEEQVGHQRVEVRMEIEIAAFDELADYLRDHVAHDPVTLRLFHCLENVGDQVIVGDSHPRGVGLLPARFRQSIHRLDCAKHVHMRDAFCPRRSRPA